jgi:hypothetical protein
MHANVQLRPMKDGRSRGSKLPSHLQTVLVAEETNCMGNYMYKHSCMIEGFTDACMHA